jgi:ABC-2 type transport system ATP-binding protein
MADGRDEGATRSLQPAAAETSLRGAAATDAIRVTALTRRFGRTEVLRELDLTVATGERVALCGPNGSGKTTLLRCIAGTVTPTAGRVAVCGHDAGSVRARRLLGVSLSQERSFYFRLTGRANLTFFAGARGMSRARASREVARLAEELELHSILDRRADRCSSGMLQQLALARALLGEPKVLLLDEPTRSLDAEAVERLWSALEARPTAAILLATHRSEDIDSCDRRFDLAASEPHRR